MGDLLMFRKMLICQGLRWSLCVIVSTFPNVAFFVKRHVSICQRSDRQAENRRITVMTSCPKSGVQGIYAILPFVRLFAEKTALEAFDEDDQNLDGFDLNNHDKKKFKAAEDHAVLERLADRLSDIYGERPIIPLWAHAEARVPNYYA